MLQVGSACPTIPDNSLLSVHWYTYKPSLAQVYILPLKTPKIGLLCHNEYVHNFFLPKDLAEADLIISHAGAGTCLEVLQIGKPLIVIVNQVYLIV